MKHCVVVILCVVLLNFFVPSVQAQLVATATVPVKGREAASNEKIALSEEAPEIYYQLRKTEKFYGDKNTINGNLFERSNLLGNIGGVRDKLVDHGVYFDMSVNQFFGGNLAGKQTSDYPRVNGTADYMLTIDTGKAGLWSGGGIFVHAENSWNADRSVNADAGALIPANFDAVLPKFNENTMALPEVYMVQALPGNVLLAAGKINFMGVADNNVFANNEQSQFSNFGLVNNPLLGLFVPYTPLGGALMWAPNKHHTIAAVVCDSNGTATTSGFDDMFDDVTLGLQYQFSPIINKRMPGNYRILAGYKTEDVRAFDIDRRQLIGQILGLVPVAMKDEDYGIMINFDQYLWVKNGGVEQYKESLEVSGVPGLARHNLTPVGIGIFGRAGVVPSDRNVIDQAYSFGIGGNGMIIPGRDNDKWGIGWSLVHLSHDLRTILKRDNLARLNAYENAGEIFYNIEVTPALHLTFNAQIIDTPVKGRDTAFVLGSRLHVDF